MRITIEPSDDQRAQKHPFPKVIVENFTDDASATESLDLVVAALTAWGFDRLLLIQAMEDYEV